MLNRVQRINAGYPRIAVISTALLSAAVIGALDFLAGYQISFAVFYLLPVGIASWYATKSWGLALALGSSLVWYIAEIASGYPYSHPAIPIWNAIVRLTFFAIIALLLAELRIRLLSETLLAKSDSLTGLLNSRAFRERLEHDLALMGRVGKPLSLMYIDLDDFKTVNDRRGHDAGDRLLRHVANGLGESVRLTDTAARLGGDEFALILPGTDLDGAQLLVRQLAETLRHVDESGQALTCSIGAVVFDIQPGSADSAVQAADRLMYVAKANGKNGHVVEYYSGLSVSEPPLLHRTGHVDAPNHIGLERY